MGRSTTSRCFEKGKRPKNVGVVLAGHQHTTIISYKYQLRESTLNICLGLNISTVL